MVPRAKMSHGTPQAHRPGSSSSLGNPVPASPTPPPCCSSNFSGATRRARYPYSCRCTAWQPDQQELDDWLAAHLGRDYAGSDGVPALHSTAVRRLLQGRIIPLLDGLDELPAGLHSAAIHEINASAGIDRPMVVTCRSREFEEAHWEAAPLLPRARVVELAPVDGPTAIAFLTPRLADRDSARWRQLFQGLAEHPDGPAARALSTPLMVRLIQQAYQDPASRPAELLSVDRFPSREAVEERLLGAFLDAAFPAAPPPGDQRPTQYGQARTERWLTFLAGHLHRVGSRDLAW